jgi:cell wall-associated NlpC family hydrolase/nucleoid-associated protein YgaU
MPHFSWAAIGMTTTALSFLFAPVAAFADSSPTSVHVVQPGDTLLQIALDAGTDTDTVVALNGLSNADVLSVGESIKVPAHPATAVAASAASTPTPASAASSYTVASGDTLWDIAQRFGTTPEAIVQQNHLADQDHLSLGTVLSLPRASASASSNTSSGTIASVMVPAATPVVTPTAAPQQGGTVSYTVQPGETLNQIAQRYNVQAAAVAQASGVSDADKIVVGSVLKVPVGARSHVVTDGETLKDIAASEKVDLASLINVNQIDDPALIRVGQVVVLPAATGSGNGTASTKPSLTPAPVATATPAPTSTPATVQGASQVAASVSTPTPLQTNASPSPTSTPSAAKSATPAPTATPSPKPAAPSPAVSAPAGSSSEAFAAAAIKLLGTPYLWGGSTLKGFDCSGLVWYVANELNKQVSRSMSGQYDAGSHPSRDQLKPGDLVFFQNTWTAGMSHNGIYIGSNRFVNAANETTGVTISDMSSAYWSARWYGATRVP